MAPPREHPARTSVEVLSTTRIGQLTGSTESGWPDLVDCQGWPLLNDTLPYGVRGVDLGANVLRGDRTYIFFGDVATMQRRDIDIENSDLVAWTDESVVLRHGGHLPRGWTFVLPFEPTDVEGQPDWQFCLKCGALFWNGDAHFKGACPLGGGHETFGVGFRFVLPFEPTAVGGQHDWRFCGKCAAMFWDGDPAFKGFCPAGPHHVHVHAGNRFVLPVAPPEGNLDVAGQGDWRFCGNCAGLFWNGDIAKGLCAGAPGGGFHLRPVLKAPDQYDPFRAPPPIFETRTVETPNGAFSFEDRIYVFAGIAEEKFSHFRRPGDPAAGQYLFSKADPSIPGPYETEFLFSPKLGWCAADQRRVSFFSHDVRGLRFVLQHDQAASSPGRMNGWRSCRRCEALFWDGDPAFKGVCQRQGAHEANPADPANYSLARGLAEGPQDQASWWRCGKCLLLFFDDGRSSAGLCPDGGGHSKDGAGLSAPHGSIEEDPKNQAHWRFCRKCSGLFFAAGSDLGTCAKDHGPHQPMGFDFVLTHDVGEDAGSQANWRCCGKCAGLFYAGSVAQGHCPKDGGGHAAAGYVFSLFHDVADAFDLQTNWRFCGKCFGLFFNGSADKGSCSSDGGGHLALGLDFGLGHNPGEDASGSWRFCMRCHGMVRDRLKDWAQWIAPCVVDNAAHPVLPADSGTGLVMIGFDTVDFRLAWMPLIHGSRPPFDSTKYYHAGKEKWLDEPDGSPDSGIFRLSRPGQYTHVSAAWLAGPRCWIALYATAWDATKQFDGPIVARVSKDLLDWSDEIRVFDPNRERAYGAYMHQPGLDKINPTVPPQEGSDLDNPGWAYGAFLLERFTTWDESARTLSLFYLLSLASPYQVQLMHSTLRFPGA